MAFTMIELLVSIAIIALLGGLVAASYSHISQRARLTTELAAGRQLITAYHAYAAENNGTLLVGYNTKDPQAFTKEGVAIMGSAAYRYVWRIAPYLNYDLSGALFVNEMRKRFPNPLAADVYEISASPSFGINAYCVGGYSNGKYNIGLASRASQMSKGTNIIVFASAGRGSGSAMVAGAHQITPPLMSGEEWGTMSPQNPPSTGSVHFRYDDKAVVVHYGGHITLKSEAELRDMRRWNLAALDADNASFPLPVR